LGLALGPRKTSLAELRAHPHGVDYGPLEPCLPQRLLTENGKVHLAPQAFVRDVERLERELHSAAPPLVLIGRRQLRGNNSWMHNAPRLMRGPERCTLLIHPLDAEMHGIVSGGSVELRSRAGAIVVPAEISDEVMPGVVSLPHGFGHDRAGAQLSVAAERAGASFNDISDERRLDDFSGNAALNGIPVEVRLLVGAGSST
jgi:anaerobic selenocysteine-containing dehydrogenase